MITVEQGIPHVVLFDTSGAEDVEINKELGNILEDEGLKATLPQVGIAVIVITIIILTIIITISVVGV